MMDDTTLELGLRAGPPSDPTYVSRIASTSSVGQQRVERGGRLEAHPEGARALTWSVAAVALASVSAGALLFAIGQDPDPTPAASSSPTASPSASPSPSDSSDPLARFVTEEVEPGVVRIINDGFRNLSWVPPGSDAMRYYDHAMAIAPDGLAWLLRPEGAYKVGLEPTWPWEERVPLGGIVSVVSDGDSDWLRRVEDGVLERMSWRPETWNAEHVRWSRGPGADFAAADAESTMWMMYRDPADRVSLYRLSPETNEWEAHDIPLPPGQPFVTGLWATDGGVVWTLTDVWGPDGNRRGFQLWRFDGSDWDQVDVPLVDHALQEDGLLAAVGPDGTAWAHWVRGGFTGENAGPRSLPHHWARHDGDGWTTFDSDALPRLLLPRNELDIGPEDMSALFQVAPDGSLWFTPWAPSGDADTCWGLASFDGGTLANYLDTQCVYAFDIASDGAIWVLAGDDYHEDPSASVETYVIRPDEASRVD